MKWHNPKDEKPIKGVIVFLKCGSVVEWIRNTRDMEEWPGNVDGWMYFSEVCKVIKKLEVKKEKKSEAGE